VTPGVGRPDRRDRMTAGPGSAGALLVGSSIAYALGYALARRWYRYTILKAPAIASAGHPAPEFPFVALLVSGGHTQLMRSTDGSLRAARGDGRRRRRRGLRQDGTVARLGYPGGPAVSRLADFGNPARFGCPGPCYERGPGLSFSGLKTAVLTAVRKEHNLCEQDAPTLHARLSKRSSMCWRSNRAARWKRQASHALWWREASAPTRNSASGCMRTRAVIGTEFTFLRSAFVPTRRDDRACGLAAIRRSEGPDCIARSGSRCTRVGPLPSHCPIR